MIGLSGRLRSSLIIGGQGIRARKLRTFLSMISLFLGVLAVVAVQAGSVIAERALLSNVELTSGKDGTLRMFLPSHEKAPTITMDALRGRSDAVGMLRASAIIGEPGVRPVNEGGAPIGENYGPMIPMECDANGVCTELPDPNAGRPPGQAIELGLQALTGDIRVFRPFRQVSGQWLDWDSKPSLAPRIVLNKEAAKAFNAIQVPAEMRITGGVANATPRIIGVVDDGDYGPQAYVRSDELLNWLPVNALSDPTYGGSIQVYASQAATGFEDDLRKKFAAAGANPDEMYTERVNIREQLESQISLMKWIFLGMASLVLLIGVAGILNVGLATVGERIEEFALRRAVGTPRLLLAGIVLAETLLTGLLTAAAAVGVGAGALKAASLLYGSQEPFLKDVAFPWQAGVAGVLAGLVAGILGGLIPALRAARIPIATVMRA